LYLTPDKISCDPSYHIMITQHLFHRHADGTCLKYGIGVGLVHTHGNIVHIPWCSLYVYWSNIFEV